ncbi:MAG: thioredoxin domain-containing protein [Alkalispirochaeta sp.]
MMDRNTLDQAASPYLRQHADNPVWWQEWSEATLHTARETGRPLFVSVGYATCHWCHVMAAEAFSDTAVAAALNRDFICIKVDREERPDIDHFLMQFLLVTRGHGGWPLNVFLTPELKPMLALTYMPVEGRSGMPGFVEILTKVLEFYTTRRDDLQAFDLWNGVSETERPPAPGDAEAFTHRLTNLVRRGDHEWGGFGLDAKFPPHSSLLYLLFGVAAYRHEGAERFLRHTLDMIARRGLHDHLQGGFFRYCVDRSWTIPHFEKMLYDQAMLLWVYSQAARLFHDDRYLGIARGIVDALEETFRLPSGAYASGHDADTHHQEGATYLWSYDELAATVGDDAMHLFEIRPGGNFEGRHHLVLATDPPLRAVNDAARNRLLHTRNDRDQPQRDDKVITSWNALAGIALIEAWRATGDRSLLDRAHTLYGSLKACNQLPDHRWIRSSLGSHRNNNEFLEDYAAVLLLQTYLLEDTETAPDRDLLREEMQRSRQAIEQFQGENGWTISRVTDLPPIPADDFDSPTPSPISLKEMALQRSALLSGEVISPPALRAEMQSDFSNLAAAVATGEWFFVERPSPPDWRAFPIHTVFLQADSTSWCFRGICYPGEFTPTHIL